MFRKTGKPSERIPIVWLAFPLTIFISSFLLFLIQPMVGKLVLPILGGAFSVWTAVMLFFTIILLFGYGYVVWLTKMPRRSQTLIHLVLIVVTVVWTVANFLVTRSFVPKNDIWVHQGIPVIALLLSLIKTLGLPCFLLATTSPLLQSWYSRIFVSKSPYWLYIISNAGSLIGLLAYPLLVEPHISLKMQQNLWFWCLTFYTSVSLTVLFVVYKKMQPVLSEKKSITTNKGSLFTWLVLPFVSTAAMLAITAQLTMSVSPAPFMWVATLGVYLLSFIVAFIDKDWYSSDFYGFLVLILIVLLSLFTFGFITIKYQAFVAIMLVGLFFISLLCNRELFKRRPEPKELSTFYLMIGLGGVIASVFTAIIAPMIFNDIWEYPLALIASSLVALFVLNKNKSLSFRIHSAIFAVIVITLTCWLFVNPLESESKQPGTKILANLRNFYGVQHVLRTELDVGYKLSLLSGETIHGLQYFVNDDEYVPTVYFAPDSGIGYAIENRPKKLNNSPIKIGVIGLGVGTIAAYCDKGDSITFYEINPQVIDASRKYFKYIENAEKGGCIVKIIQGDGRISLEKELDKGEVGNFDVLAVDAFTDDSIPVHLITREALQLYLSHLAEGGVIAFHTSNRYVNLSPVLESLAGIDNFYYNHIQTTSSWNLLSKYPISLQSYIPRRVSSEGRYWTDDYSNILSVLLH
jgi:hypothetical protein